MLRTILAHWADARRDFRIASDDQRIGVMSGMAPAIRWVRNSIEAAT